MAEWKLQLFGLFRASHGNTVRLRTRQQKLLLARLAIYRDSSISRSETAALLWPDVEQSRAMTYLRRAVMELRVLGLKLQSEGDRLMLDPGQILTDLDELSPDSDRFVLTSSHVQILEDLDHPIADEVREVVQDKVVEMVAQYQEKLRKKAKPVRSEADGVLTWLGDAIIKTRPDVALEILATQCANLAYNNPPEAVLELLTRALTAAPAPTQHRVTVGMYAGYTAHVLTRYSLAEKLYLEAENDAESLGDIASQVRTFSALSFLRYELRDSAKALEYGGHALALAEQVDDDAAKSNAWGNHAGILWHLMDFEGSILNYHRAWTITQGAPTNLTHEANLAYLWAVFGCDIPLEMDRSLEVPESAGYVHLAWCYYVFSVAYGYRQVEKCLRVAADFVEMAGEQNVERLVCVAVDCAAFAFHLAGLPVESTACMRIGTNLRSELGHRRSPGEKHAVRRNIPGPYFSPEIAAYLPILKADDPVVTSRAISERLRHAANSMERRN